MAIDGRHFNIKQDCFLQKEARVCVSDAIIIDDSKFKYFFFVVEDEQVKEEADVLMWILWLSGKAP